MKSNFILTFITPQYSTQLSIYTLLGIVHIKKMRRHTVSYFRNNDLKHTLSCEIAGSKGYHLTRWDRNCKRSYKLPLRICKLLKCQFRNKGNTFACLNHTHECLNASKRISLLAITCRLHIAELDKLVAETMSLVKKPQEMP